MKIPGPKPNLFFGNTFQYLEGIHVTDINNHKKYGDLYGIFFMGYPCIVISDISSLRQILIKDFDKFINRPKSGQFDGEHNLLSHMLFILRDKRWKDVRNSLTPAFSTAKIKSIFSIVLDCIRITESIIDKSISEKNHQFDTRKILGNLVMDIITKSAFGLDENLQLEEKSKFMQMANKMFNFSFFNPRLLFMVLFPNVAETIRKYCNYQIFNHDVIAYFVNLLNRTVQKRRKHLENKRNDLLQTLINLSLLNNETIMEINDTEKFTDNMHSHKSKEQVALSEIELMAQCFMFIAAAFETTTTTLQFLFYSLAVNPKVQQKAYDEVMNTINDKAEIDYKNLSQMDYINQIMMETLRMYPPTTRLQRECKHDTTIMDGEICIPKGSTIVVPIFVIHRNKQYYEEPDKFDPERFDICIRQQRDPLTFMPFGYGPRQCIGMRFAQVIMRTIVASLIRKYKFTANDYSLNKPLQIITTGFTKPAKPIILHVEHRSKLA